MLVSNTVSETTILLAGKDIKPFPYEYPRLSPLVRYGASPQKSQGRWLWREIGIPSLGHFSVFRTFSVTETSDQVVVDQTAGLHVGIKNRATQELEP